MSAEQNESLEEVKDLLDIDTNNDNARILQFLTESLEFFQEQLTIFSLDAVTQPNNREKSLIEKLAAAKWTSWRRPEHSTGMEKNAKEEIKTHVRAVAAKHSDDGIAGGTNQFRFSTGNVREGFGL